MANKNHRDKNKKKAPPEEAPTLLRFTDETGEVYAFEPLDEIEYDGARYAVLLPEEGGALDNGMAHIYRIEEDPDSDEAAYIGLDDQSVIDAVFELFMEAHADEFDAE